MHIILFVESIPFQKTVCMIIIFSGEGPRVLIMAPTRELAQQVYIWCNMLKDIHCICTCFNER